MAGYQYCLIFLAWLLITIVLHSLKPNRGFDKTSCSISVSTGLDIKQYPTRNSGPTRRFLREALVPPSLKCMAALKFANITVCATYMVLLAGDIQENPGPVTDACAVCTKGCRKNQMAIQCDSCDKWFHAKCISMKRTEYDKLCEPSLAWECITCLSPYGGTAVYNKISSIPGYPVSKNANGVEITIVKLAAIPHITIIGVYRSPRVAIRQMCTAMMQLLVLHSSEFNIFIGDFNVNWLNEKERIPLYNLFVRDNSYRQLVLCYTTDNRTTIDHIYTNLPELYVNLHILETYFSDHIAICALIRT